MMSQEDQHYTEVTVYGYKDPKTPLDVLQNAVSPRFLEQLNAEGAGQVSLSLLDPKYQQNASLLDFQNVVKLSCDGKVRSAFLIQNREDDLIGEGEDSDKAVTFSGNGLRQWLDGAAVFPEGGLKQSSPDSRVFSWASQRGSWYTAADWTAPTRIEKYHIAPDGTPDLQYTYNPAEWPDAPGAWWVWSQPYTYANVGGKRTATTPEGTSYFRYEFTVSADDAGSFSLFAAADDSYTAFMDSALAIDGSNPPGATQYHATVRYDFELDAGKHILAFRVTNRKRNGQNRNPAALIAALFKVGDADAGIPARIITTTGGSGWLVNGYPPVEPGWSIGEILLTLLNEAKARGVQFPNWITPTFTADKDSNGVAWGENLPFSFNVGDTYLDVLKTMEELAVEAWIDPDTYAFNVTQNRGADKTVVTSTSDAVVLREGWNLTSAGDSGESDPTNSLLLKTDDGWVVSQPSDTTSRSRYGVREGTLSTGVNSSLSKKLANKVFAQKALAETGSTYTLVPRPGAEPFVDFNIGDDILAPNETGDLVTRRVSSIAVTADSANNPIYAVEFDTIFETKEQEYDRMAKLATGSGLGAGFVSADGAGSGGTSPSTGTGTGYTTGAPQAPVNISVTSEGYFTPTGVAQSRATFSWDPVDSDVNGVPIKGVSKYEVLGRRSTNTAYQSIGFVSGAFTQLVAQGLPANEDYFFVMRTYVTDNRVSAISDPPVAHSLAAPVTKMPAPTAPTLSSKLGTVTATWNGKLSTGVRPAQFAYLYAEYSDTQTGTYTQVGSIPAAGGIVITGLTVGATVWVRLGAVDNIGRASDPSASVSIVVKGVDTSDLGQQFQDSLTDSAKAASDALAAAKAATASAAALAAQATDFIKDPQFQTGADKVRSVVIGSPADANATNLPRGALGYGRVSVNDNIADGTTIPAVSGRTYRFSVDVRPAAAWATGRDPFRLMLWYLTGDGASSNAYYTGGDTTFTSASDTWRTATWDYTVPGPAQAPVLRPALRAGSNTYLVTNFHVLDITDIKTALDTADLASRTAQTALGQSGQALTSANGKSSIFYLPDAPVLTAPAVLRIGDTWFETDNDNKQYNWDGSAWQPKLFGAAAIAQNSIGSAQLATSINTSIAKSAQDASDAKILANTAKSTADGKNTIFRSTSNPTASTPGNAVGDFWQTRDATSGQVSAEFEWTGSTWASRTLTNALIANLDAGKINVGVLSGDRIAANSLTAAKLAIGDFTNLVDDPEFSAGGWVRRSGATTASNIVTTAGLPGPSWKLDGVGGEVSVWTTNFAQVDPGASYFVGFRAQNQLTGTSPAAFMRLYWYTETGTYITYSEIPIPASGAATAWQDYSNTFVAPATARRAIPVFIHGSNNTGGSWWFGRVRLRRMNGGELIVDGSVTATKMQVGTITAASGILADAAITNAKIAFAAVDTANIVDAAITNAKISNLDAAKITTGFLDAGRLQAASITSRMLAVGDLKDYFDGSDFEDQTLVPWLTIPDTYSSLDTTFSHSGNQSAKFSPPAPPFTPKTTNNLANNPKASNNLTNWSALTSGSGANFVRATASDPSIYQGLTSYVRLTFGSGASKGSAGIRYTHGVTAGRKYSVSLGVRSTQVNYGAQFRIIWVNSSGVEVGSRSYSQGDTTDGTTTWTQITVENMTAPTGATQMWVDYYGPNGGADPVAGQNIYATGLMINEGTSVLEYFDGDDPSIPGSDDYSWTGTAGNSISKRVQSSPTDTRTNLVVNPRFATTMDAGTVAYSSVGASTSTTAQIYRVTGIASPTGSTGGTAARLRSYSSSTLSFVDVRVRIPGVMTGKSYSASLAARLTSMSGASSARLYIQWYAGDPQNGGSIISTVSQDFAGRWSGYKRFAIRNRAAPAGATFAVFILRVLGNISNQQYVDLGALAFIEGDTTDYFDGSYQNTDADTYAWNAGADSSATIQVSVADRPTATYTLNTNIPVKNGQSFSVSGWAYPSTGYDGNVDGAYISLLDASDGTLLGKAPMGIQALSTSNEWQAFGSTIAIPDSVKLVSALLSVNHTSGVLYLDDLTLKVAGVSLIQDGSITTPKLAANSITTNLLAAGAVQTEQLDAYAITSKHTITGALIRTSTTGARTEMNAAGLQVLGDDNTPLVRMGFDIPTGISIRDPNSSAMIPLSNMSFGTKYYPSSESGQNSRLAVPVGSENNYGNYATEDHGNWTAPSSRVMWLFFAISDASSRQNFNVEAQAYMVDSTDTSVGARVTLTNAVPITYQSGFFMGVKSVVPGRIYGVKNSYRALRNFSAPASPPAYVVNRLNILMPV